MKFIAHIRESDKQIQTVEEHLVEVKKLAESYGEPLGVKYLTGLAGMLRRILYGCVDKHVPLFQAWSREH